MFVIIIIIIFIFSYIITVIAGGGSRGGSSGGSSGSSSGGSSGDSSGGSSGDSSGDSSGGSGGDGINFGKYNSELKPIIKLINNQDYKNALMELETFVYENPQSADGWNYIGFVSRNLEKYEDAERYYGLGLEIDSKHKGILEYQGELYLKTNRIDKAKANLAMLDDLCSFNCTYKNKLAKKIDEAVSSAF